MSKAFENYLSDTENPEYNLALARFYWEIGQTASALSFFLRCAERTQDPNISYFCLIMMGHCFDRQGHRDGHTLAMYRSAKLLLPKRPEAHFMTARFYERRGKWGECYEAAELALQTTDCMQSIPNPEMEYPGAYGLLFEKAVAAWWYNRENESRRLFRQISEQYYGILDEVHKAAVYRNIANLGIGPESVTHQYYQRDMYGMCRLNFAGLEDISRNFSQCFQDIFVLAALRGKRSGSYLEIGSAGPFYGNNTALLESQFEWVGVGVELNENFVNDYRANRKNVVLHHDATTLNYDDVLSVIATDSVVDYLQLDVDPPSVTFEVLKKIPFDKYKFRVITYEHDHYVDETRSYRYLSREFLKSRGYVLIAPDISPEGHSSFEDWWVHPDLIDSESLAKLRGTHKDVISGKDYMFPPVKFPDNFSWGPIEKNEWFKNLVNREVFIDRVYERFVQPEDGDVIFDIGASVGPFIRSLKINPKMVYAFEPHPEAYETLMNNISNKVTNIPVTAWNGAIGPVNGTIRINGMLSDRTEVGGGDDEVRSLTIQHAFGIAGENRIDFLKIDCEGGEYDIFTDENMDWIMANVRKISGEFHLATPEQKQKFRKFRDTYLKKFRNFHIESLDYVDIKHSLFTDWFIEYYQCVNIHIDNRYPKSYWAVTNHPTLEITTVIPKKGCVVDCAICPQRTLEKAYTDDHKIMRLEDFKKYLHTVPKQVRITFSGFVEPWLNSECTDMVEYAHYRGHPVSVFTTGVGMKPEDVYRLAKIPFAGDPNGGFVLHLPDEERVAKHPITKNFIETMEAFANVRIQGFRTMCMTANVHPAIRHVFPTSFVPDFWNRAGNLIGEAILKDELKALSDKYKGVHRAEEQKTCGCVEDLYHNVLLPNGDVSLCCMDYGLENILGNMNQLTYDDVVPKPKACFEICRACENGVNPPSE